MAEEPTPAARAEARAKKLASREHYSVAKVHRTYAPEGNSCDWEVLILGRFTGDTRAGILADPMGVELPYTIYVDEAGIGFVASGW